MLPSPLGSQTNPIRGPNFRYLLFSTLLPGVYVGSPGIGHTRGSIDVHLTLQSLREPRRIKVHELAVFAVHRQIGLPPQSVGHGKPRRDFPGVLRIQAEVVLPQREPVDVALDHSGGDSDQEVGHPETWWSVR